MPRCDCLACSSWIDVARSYHAGCKLEAATAAALLLREGHGECYWAPRIVEEMEHDGWLSDGEVKV